MYLEQQIREAIEAEADKLIERYQAYHNALHLEHERKLKRVVSTTIKEVKTPEAWDVNRLHNPFYVRRKSGSIARSIARKIGTG